MSALAQIRMENPARKRRGKKNVGELLIFGNPKKKSAREITDRAARYRANVNMPRVEKRCGFCGSKKNIDVCHVDGHEKNNKPSNLMYGCRSCNVKAANTMRRAGLGTITRQYNPSEGAQTLAQWVTAVLSMKGESDQMTPGQAVDIIRATPHSRRSTFARQIWQRRRRSGRNPATAAAKKAARDRAARIRDARLNPTYVYFSMNGRDYRTDGKTVEGKDGQTWNRTGSLPVVIQARKEWAARSGNPATHMQVSFDPGIKKYLAYIYHPKFGNLYASGFTKKQAAHALHDRVREAQRTGTHRNPKRGGPRRRRADRNPSETKQAVRLFQGFHGHDPKEIAEKHVSAAVRLDYTALGDLNYLVVETPIGKEATFTFDDDGVKLASSPEGKQLYCIGGNQNILPLLDERSREKDFIDVGECLEVEYLARKVHADYRPVKYYHEFGEINGSRPRLMFDKVRKQLFFIGGDYFIDVNMRAPGTPLGKVSPGIEN